MTGANSGAYLGLVCARAARRPSIVLVRARQEFPLKLSSHRCIVYESIKESGEVLSKELKQIPAKGLA